jgi:hypothetical protein
MWAIILLVLVAGFFILRAHAAAGDTPADTKAPQLSPEEKLKLTQLQLRFLQLQQQIQQLPGYDTLTAAMTGVQKDFAAEQGTACAPKPGDKTRYTLINKDGEWVCSPVATPPPPAAPAPTPTTAPVAPQVKK